MPREQDHSSPQVMLPLLFVDAAATPEAVKDHPETLLPVVGKFNGAQSSVNDPTQDKLAGGPSSITLEELLDRDCLMMTGFILSWLCKHRVNGMEYRAAQCHQTASAALSKPQKVVHK